LIFPTTASIKYPLNNEQNNDFHNMNILSDFYDYPLRKMWNAFIAFIKFSHKYSAFSISRLYISQI